ncbi:spore germination protein [Calderihabitans maritimus]|uniref:GerA spore germination protein n=1 Tax=Calderihabitans maritimus TaxID=1246530 RepID=A0A1Z5HPA1_9FIRM|nr:spore germination protein [Calderihabitans maritimus]GAW91356.1 GerA spore germination protein [Calderihabitans maritimus]
MIADDGQKAKISKKLDENLKWLNEALGIDKNFDIISRQVHFAGKDAFLLFVDGFTKDNIMMYLLRSLTLVKREDIVVNTLEKIFKTYIDYIEVDQTDDLHQVVDRVLAGQTALFIEGEQKAILIDAREYPIRSPEEPDLERVVRGSRDGFVETLVYNTALIRRRIRDPKLRMELMEAGTRSKTDICIAYLEDVANPNLVQLIKEKIEAIRMDGLPMAEKSVEELIMPGSFWNPFPKIRYTERPDVAAAHLLEGHVLVLVDTSPSVMILPATFFHHVQHAEEYRQSPLVGAFLRWVRFFGIAASVFLAPVWLLVALEPRLLPEGLKFIGPDKPGQVGLMWQFFFAELGIDLLRMAAVHTPSALTTALGLIAAILIGEVAIDIGLFAPEVVLYMSIAAVGVFATPSYELGMANTLVRILLIFAVGLFRLPGLLVGFGLVFIFLALSKSFGVPYLWPLIPFNWTALKSILVRSPVPIQNTRPSALKPQDASRQPLPATKPLKRKSENSETNGSRRKDE